MDVMRSPHTLDLTRRIEKAGYYPELVADSLDLALAGEDVAAHLVHAETTFDSDTVRRHLSVLVLTATRLVFVHADDHGDDEHEDSVACHRVERGHPAVVGAVGDADPRRGGTRAVQDR